MEREQEDKIYRFSSCKKLNELRKKMHENVLQRRKRKTNHSFIKLSRIRKVERKRRLTGVPRVLRDTQNRPSGTRTMGQERGAQVFGALTYNWMSGGLESLESDLFVLVSSRFHPLTSSAAAFFLSGFLRFFHYLSCLSLPLLSLLPLPLFHLSFFRAISSFPSSFPSRPSWS